MMTEFKHKELAMGVQIEGDCSELKEMIEYTRRVWDENLEDLMMGRPIRHPRPEYDELEVCPHCGKDLYEEKEKSDE